MDDRTAQLIMSAERLRSLGVELETARARLKILAESGYSCQSAEMTAAYRAFRDLEQEWNVREQQHLTLRREILTHRGDPVTGDETND